MENFKVQFEAFNAPKLDTPITDKEWERIFNLMLGKSVFQSGCDDSCEWLAVDSGRAKAQRYWTFE